MIDVELVKGLAMDVATIVDTLESGGVPDAETVSTARERASAVLSEIKTGIGARRVSPTLYTPPCGRSQHSLGVAEYMYVHAKGDPVRAYLLGYLHDVGVAFDPRHHELAGSIALHSAGYRDYREVGVHGLLSPNYSSPLLDELNIADLHVDRYGRQCTFEDRLMDIHAHHGNDGAADRAWKLGQSLGLDSEVDGRKKPRFLSTKKKNTKK